MQRRGAKVLIIATYNKVGRKINIWLAIENSTNIYNNEI